MLDFSLPRASWFTTSPVTENMETPKSWYLGTSGLVFEPKLSRSRLKDTLEKKYFNISTLAK